MKGIGGQGECSWERACWVRGWGNAATGGSNCVVALGEKRDSMREGGGGEGKSGEGERVREGRGKRSRGQVFCARDMLLK